MTQLAATVQAELASLDARLLAAGLALLLAVCLTLLAAAHAGARAGRRYQHRFESHVGRRLNDLLLFVDAGRLFQANLLLAVAASGTVWLLTGSWLMVAAAVAALPLLPGVVLARLARRRRQRFAQQLPDALMLIAGAFDCTASTIQEHVAEMRIEAGFDDQHAGHQRRSWAMARSSTIDRP